MSKQTISLIAFVALVILGLVLPSQQHAVPKRVTQLAATENNSDRVGVSMPKRSATGEFTSPAGLHYGKDWSGKFDSRIAHIMAHTQPDPSKVKHSIYLETSQEGIIALLDEAWKKRGPPERQGNGRGREVFDVNMGRRIGAEGERCIRMVVEADSADIVTAYPVR